MTGFMATKSSAATAPSESTAAILVCLVAWAVPGAGHLWLGRRQKGVIFLAALLVMFALGLWLQGRIFPLQPSEPLVALAAIANFGVGIPWLLARMLDLGSGTVTAVTYEYGNSFLIVAGLLNFLIILDAYDIAAGRK
jgi:hypothetical protein